MPMTSRRLFIRQILAAIVGPTAAARTDTQLHNPSSPDVAFVGQAPIAVELIRIVVGQQHAGKVEGYYHVDARAYLKITEGGEPSLHWKPISLGLGGTFRGLRDLTGCVLTGVHRQVRGGATHRVDFYFYGSFFPPPEKWELQLELEQQSGFSAAQLWRIRDVPASPQSPRVVASTARGDLRVDLAVNPGETHRTEVSISSFPGSFDLRASLIRAVDNLGRRVKCAQVPGGLGEIVFAFRPSKKATTVDFTFVLHRSVSFQLPPTTPQAA